MKQMIPVVKTKTYAVCPCCDNPTSTIDHLLGQDFTTAWYCDDCGERYSLKFCADGSVFTQPKGERKEKHLVLLKNGNVGLVVEGMSFSDGSDPSAHHEYYYNEHTCPTNYMSNVLAVVDLSYMDADPHGIFEYVTTLDYDEDANDCNYDWTDVLQHFKD